MAARSTSDGRPKYTSRSKRPGRRNAASIASGLHVFAQLLSPYEGAHTPVELRRKYGQLVMLTIMHAGLSHELKFFQ
jgi:hypothetical protein